MRRVDRGTALVMTLVLLSGLGALALGAAATAVTALALAGQQQQAQQAFEAAETGIVHALAQAAVMRGAGTIPDTAHPADLAGHSSYRTETQIATGSGALPVGFSIGESGSGFGARHYVVVADGRAGRTASARLEQGFYLVVPTS